MSDSASTTGLSDEKKSLSQTFPKGSCQACGFKLHKSDKHRKCYKCLGTLHNMSQCSHCAGLSRGTFFKRHRAQNYFLQHSEWPQSLESLSGSGTPNPHAQRARSDALTLAAAHEFTLADQQPDQEVEGEDAGELEEEDVTIVHEDPPTSSQAEPVEIIQSEEFKTFFSQFLQAQKSKRPPPTKQVSSTPATSVPSKRKAPGPSKGSKLPSKAPKLDLHDEPVIKSMRSDIDTMGSKLDLILSKLSGSEPNIRPTPSSLSIPPPEVTSEEEEEDSLSETGTSFESPALDTNLSRTASRSIWLSGLGDICPSLPEVVQPETSSSKSPHFKLLKKKSERPLMPFLPEVSDACKDAAALVKPATCFKRINAFYKTSGFEEQQLLGPRSVPSVLSGEVSSKNLSALGLSEASNRLHLQSKWGPKEQMAIASHTQATAYLRITNNLQLSLSSLEDQLEQSKVKLDLLSSREFHSSQDKAGVQEVIEDLLHKFNVMSLAVTDLSHSNVDLLQASSFQYVKSVQDRADSWIQSTDLPKSVKAAVVKSKVELPTPGVASPLPIISGEAQKTLRDFVSTRKAQNEKTALLKAIKAPVSHTAPNPASRPSTKSPLQQQFAQWQRSQSSWSAPSSRGSRGGRGTGRGSRGRASSRQPFSKGRASQSKQ